MRDCRGLAAGCRAWDVIWPAYTAQLYATFTSLSPWQMSWRYIALRQLVPILGVAYAVIGMVLAARRGVEAIPKMGVLTLALFYVVASFKYFGHLGVFLQYAWMLIVPTILLFDLAGRRGQIFILVSLLPGWLCLGYLLREPPPGAARARYQMPNGDVLFPHWPDDPPLLPRLELLFQQPLGKAASGTFASRHDCPRGGRLPLLLPGAGLLSGSHVLTTLRPAL